MYSVEEAFDKLLSLAQSNPSPDVRLVEINQALHCILAENIAAPIAVPPANNSAMDGYAFCAADVIQYPCSLPVSQRIAAGDVPVALQKGTAARIFTGAVMPEGADTVLMQERTNYDSEKHVVTLLEAVPQGNAVRLEGSDIALGYPMLAQGSLLNTTALALLASVGVASVPVYKPIRVASFLTGSELVAPGSPLSPGKIFNSNGTLLRHLLAGFPVEHRDLGVVQDSLAATEEALLEAAEHADVVITTGGVSVGEEDHVKKALEKVGTLETWKIAIKPGKPFAWGRIQRQNGSHALFIGLPGNPMSALVTFSILVRPFLLQMAGMTATYPKPIPMRADFAWEYPDKRREYLRVRINEDGGLSLYPQQQSGILSSALWADGLVDNPSGQVIEPGDFVAFLPWNSLSVR